MYFKRPGVFMLDHIGRALLFHLLKVIVIHIGGCYESDAFDNFLSI